MKIHWKAQSACSVRNVIKKYFWYRRCFCFKMPQQISIKIINRISERSLRTHFSSTFPQTRTVHKGGNCGEYFMKCVLDLNFVWLSWLYEASQQTFQSSLLRTVFTVTLAYNVKTTLLCYQVLKSQRPVIWVCFPLSRLDLPIYRC